MTRWLGFTVVVRAALPAFLMLNGLMATAATTSTVSDPEVDHFNVRVGTQTFAPKYRFSTNSSLVETASAIRQMGSDVVKFYLGRNFPGQYGISLPGNINSLQSLAANEPSCRHVLDLPFRHIIVWAYCFSAGSDTSWKDGFSMTERSLEQAEIYALTRYLLTNYNNSGKSFYLGHWEGDWYLLPNYDTTVNPSAIVIQGMIDWLNARQEAVDAAKRDVPHTNVAVYHYTEVNRVRDAMVNGASNNQRLVNTVLPWVTNLDFVSWSAYDGMNLGGEDLRVTLDYIEAQLPTNKSTSISGRRVWIGEYGWGGTLSSEAQEPPTRAFIQKVLPWSPRFVLFWQMYDNENRAYWLIDNNHTLTPSYHLHSRFINNARLQTARFKESYGRLPNDGEFSTMLQPTLDQALPAMVPVLVSNLPPSKVGTNFASAQGSVTQNVYGDERATARVFWGKGDGGTNATAWEHSTEAGRHERFGTTVLSVDLTNLSPKAVYYYRFQATNSTSESWAPSTMQFRTEVVNSNDYGSSVKITLTESPLDTSLHGFPALIRLGTNIQGFSYRHFASPVGHDLRMTEAPSSRPIAFEIDEWDTNGTSWIWVRIPQPGTAGSAVCGFWGNPLSTQLPETATDGSTWKEDYMLVWHLKESSLPFKDSAGEHPATMGDPPTSYPAGVVGRAAWFNGSSDYLRSAALQLGDSFTLSAWVRTDPSVNSIQTVWANKTGGNATDGFALFINSWQTKDAKLILETGNGTVGAAVGTAINAVTSGTWHHVAAAVDRAGGMARLYVDGEERASGSVRTDFANTAPLFLGRFTDAIYYFRGAIDEARIHRGLASSATLRAEWLNAGSNLIFQSYSPITRQSPQAALVPGGDAAFVLTWPAFGVGFALTTATSLIPPVAWQTLPQIPMFTNTHWYTPLPLESSFSRFFRLESIP